MNRGDVNQHFNMCLLERNTVHQVQSYNVGLKLT